MNKKLRQFERESGIEIYGLGLDREKWERRLEHYAELIIEHCAMSVENNGRFLTYQEMANRVRRELK